MVVSIKQVLDEWAVDAKIDEHDLDHESLNIPLVHGKYLKYLLDARIEAKRLYIQKKKLYGFLSAYYRGELNNPTDLQASGRSPWPLHVKYNNLDQYIDQDQEYIAACDEAAYAEERVAALEEIMRMLHNRNFQIKGALDFLKIKSGF